MKYCITRRLHCTLVNKKKLIVLPNVSCNMNVNGLLTIVSSDPISLVREITANKPHIKSIPQISPHTARKSLMTGTSIACRIGESWRLYRA